MLYLVATNVLNSEKADIMNACYSNLEPLIKKQTSELRSRQQYALLCKEIA